MISSTIKVATTIPPYDFQLALQTAAGHLTIRALPTSTIVPATSIPPLNSNSTSNQNPPSDGSGNQKNGLSRPILEYMSLAIVVIIIACVIFRRLRAVQDQHELFSQVRSNARGYRLPSQRCRSSRLVELRHPHSYEQSYTPNPDLPAFPVASHTRRRINAADIDSSGRRTEDLVVERDHDGELGVKDVLPPYEYFGGPPKYLELEMHSRNRSPLSGNIHRPDAGLDNANSPLPQNNNSRDADIHTLMASSHTARQTGQPEDGTPDTAIVGESLI